MPTGLIDQQHGLRIGRHGNIGITRQRRLDLQQPWDGIRRTYVVEALSRRVLLLSFNRLSTANVC